VQNRNSDIIYQLEKQILPLGGFKTLRTDSRVNIGFPAIEQAFPNACFPIGCVHEFVCGSAEDLSATNGFIAGLTGKFLQLGGVCLWISNSRSLFPPALKRFNVNPEQIIFIDLKRDKDCLYVMEDALKCNKLCMVVGDLKQISFKESRRFQLATEQSRVTGLLIRNQPRVLNTIASLSRWRIRSVASELADGLPGVGFPRWKVELLKVRNGCPAQWTIEWVADSFVEVQHAGMVHEFTEERKVG
jgi:protein ImuA